MERRALLKDIFLLGITASLPLKHLFAAVTRPFHQFRLGELELTVITDGAIRMTPVQPTFAPGIPSASVDSLLVNSFRSTKEIDLGINILVIRKGKQTILIDTGTGNGFDIDFGTASGWLPQSLTDAGIPPSSITDVIITHAHPDHIGGLFNKDGSLVFAKAQVYLSAIEYAFWTSDKPDFSKSVMQESEQLKQILAATKKVLKTLKPTIHLFDDETTLFDCIRLERAAGHTPGHTIVHVYSRDEELVHIADLLHSDALQFQHAEWGFSGDTDIKLAAATREKVLASLTASKTKVFAYHLPWPGIGHVRSKGQAYEWIMETYPIPG
jgi:glyoxylase-like metal-dependent hydrolase (beta-lactamase superfamily II)